MSIEEITLLINNKNTTVDLIVKQLQNLIDKFQQKKLKFYMNEFKHDINEADVHNIAKIDLDEQTLIIYENLQKDSLKYFNEYSKSITDNVLDLINEDKLDKTSAFNFLAILTTMKDILEEERAKFIQKK